jgi:Fe-Mn family superoxide dismutase
MAFTLPELPFAYDAMAPLMSAETFEYHHDKHHKAYVDKGNELLAGSGLEDKSLEEIIIAAAKDPAKTGLYNNAGQHWNHALFWNSMTPEGGGAMPGSLEKALLESFGSMDDFRTKFIETGITQFGSGWCWLVQDKASGQLELMKTANADSPLTENKKALFVCDVWEHSYYIDYRNARPKYLETFIDSLVNWEFAAENFETR